MSQMQHTANWHPQLLPAPPPPRSQFGSVHAARQRWSTTAPLHVVPPHSSEGHLPCTASVGRSLHGDCGGIGCLASPTVSVSQARSVAADSTVEQELRQLRAENEALRRALAREQGVSPTEVQHALNA